MSLIHEQAFKHKINVKIKGLGGGGGGGAGEHFTRHTRTSIQVRM